MQRFFSILADAVDALRGHRRQVHRRRDHGRLRGADRPRGPRAARLLRGPADARRRRRATRPSCAAREGLNFSVRIGINSGEVVAGAIGAGGADGDYTAIGHTVGLAQRMEALAEPGKAYLTETHRRARRAASSSSRTSASSRSRAPAGRSGSSSWPGSAQARSRLDLSRERGFSRFVGRGRGDGVLRGGARAAPRTARASVVGVVAEPGVGKSRLCHEFAERCRDDGVEVFEAQAQAHGQSIPFMPVLQMLRAYFGIGEREPEQIAREKIAGRALLLDPELRRRPAAALRLPRRPRPRPAGPPDERRGAAAGAGRDRLPPRQRRRAAARRVVVDDRGPALDRRGQRRDARRPGRLDRGHQDARGRQLPARVHAALGRLERLPRDRRWSRWREADTRELLRDLAGEDPSLDGLDEPIHERTQGNPFFIEEIVRELAEAGHLEGERGAYRLARPIEDTGVPATVQAILAARIDRLEPGAKQLLQVASVVGKEVGGRALRPDRGARGATSSSRCSAS